VTNSTVLAQSNVLARTTAAPQVFVWTNAAVGAVALGARVADNLGAQATSAPVNLTVLERLPMAAGPIALSRQSGLFEQTVTITNPTPLVVDAVRLLVQNLASWATVYNATGTTNGTPFLQTTQPLAPGQSASLLIQYYTMDYREVPPPTLTVQVLSVSPSPSALDIIKIDRVTSLADGSVQLDFAAPSNRTCYVQYSQNLGTWRTALPAIVTSSERTQWIDKGPPITDSQPAGRPYRIYRVLVMP
jgi:hypothetical protein